MFSFFINDYAPLCANAAQGRLVAGYTRFKICNTFVFCDMYFLIMRILSDSKINYNYFCNNYYNYNLMKSLLWSLPTITLRTSTSSVWHCIPQFELVLHRCHFRWSYSASLRTLTLVAKWPVALGVRLCWQALRWLWQGLPSCKVVYQLPVIV